MVSKILLIIIPMVSLVWNSLLVELVLDVDPLFIRVFVLFISRVLLLSGLLEVLLLLLGTL